MRPEKPKKPSSPSSIFTSRSLPTSPVTSPVSTRPHSPVLSRSQSPVVFQSSSSSSVSFIKPQTSPPQHHSNQESLLDWLTLRHLEKLYDILIDLGVDDVEGLKYVQMNDFDGKDAKPIHTRRLIAEIDKMKSMKPTPSFRSMYHPSSIDHTSSFCHH